MTSEESQEPIAIPYTELSEDTLRGLIESFILREGTDYGEKELSLEQKVAQVIGQLQRREAQLVFDPQTETANIVVRLPLADGFNRSDAP